MTGYPERGDALVRRAEAQALDAVLVFSPENRRYLSGFTGSSAYLLLTAHHRWLVTDFRYTEQAGMETEDYIIIQQDRHPFEHIAALLTQAGARTVGFEADKVTVEAYSRLGQYAPAIQWQGISGWVEDLRRIKSPGELAIMREAAHIADQAMGEVLPRVQAGMTEIEVALDLEFGMRRLGAQALAFDTIVASGPRGSLPHAKPTERRLEAGDVVTIDFGARYRGYHSDETITFALGDHGPHRDQMRRVYDIVWQAQQAGIAQVKPGVLASSVDLASRSVIAAAGYGDNFGHSTGHGVGLEVHEAPWASRRPVVDYTLEPGMVITVEPGIYLPGIGGVRLEDSLIVTKSGSQRLTSWDKAWSEW